LTDKAQDIFKEGDFSMNARGLPKWKVMVGRAKKHMVREGYLQDGQLLKWTVTKKGENIAKSTKMS
jgi:hypothetical protein